MKKKILAAILALAAVGTAVGTISVSRSDDRLEVSEATESAASAYSSAVSAYSSSAAPEKEERIIGLLTDTELCLLEQLTYLDEDVARAASDETGTVDFIRISEADRGKTIAEILSPFDEKAISNLKAHTEPVCEAKIGGLEWARLLKFLKSSRLSRLVLEDVMPDGAGYHPAVDQEGRQYSYPLGMCFSEGTGGSEAVIAFKGTTGPAEWADNVRAATLTDTPFQRKSLEFTEKCAERFGAITVVGHSKGSNKAMYAAIMCDSVTRCVGFDGQGFSKAFLEAPEVAERIENRADLIRNYSLAGDFVNILLYQIPGSHQLFCKGYCVDTFSENHSPNSFFQQSEDAEDDELKYEAVQVGDTAYYVPLFQPAVEEPAVEKLRSFTDYMLTKGDNTDSIIDYLARIVPILAVGEDEEGNVYDAQGKVKAVMSDPGSLAALISGLRGYAKENELDAEYVDLLIKTFSGKES